MTHFEDSEINGYYHDINNSGKVWPFLLDSADCDSNGDKKQMIHSLWVLYDMLLVMLFSVVDLFFFFNNAPSKEASSQG